VFINLTASDGLPATSVQLRSMVGRIVAAGRDEGQNM
jgi:hypothetical protein